MYVSMNPWRYRSTITQKMSFDKILDLTADVF